MSFFGRFFVTEKTSPNALKWKEIVENIVFFKIRAF